MKQINTEICIIGGSGFVGKSILSCFNKGFFKRFYVNKIYVICRNPSKIALDKKFSSKKIKFIKIDILNLKTLPECNYYIYSSETSNLKKYKKNKTILLYKKNINNFCNILKKQKNNSKVLYVSSGSLEKKKNKDYKNYNKVKKYSETTIRRLTKFNHKVLIARCYSFISEFLPFDKHFAIGNFIKDALDKKKKFIRVKSKFNVFRSYMYSDDLGFWLVKILLFSKKNNYIYNVGSDQIYEIGEVAKIIGDLLNKPILRPKINSSKIDSYFPNLKNVKKELNLYIKYDLIKSIKITLKKIIKDEKN